MEQTGLIAARAAVYLTLLPAAGLPLYVLSAGRTGAFTPRARRAVAVFALLAALASGWWLLASVAAMADLPLAGLDRETVSAVAAATPLGLVLKLRLAALALLCLAALLPLPPFVTALAGLIAIATAAFTGHAGATEGLAGTLHRVADVAHLAGAACWLAALLVFLGGSLASADEALEPRLARFARTGTAIVAVLVVTGLANTLLIAGWPVALGSRWTLLLGAKLSLFAAMLGLAALNRWRLAPALAAGMPGARQRLRASLTMETLAAIGVVALVSALGTLDPAGG